MHESADTVIDFGPTPYLAGIINRSGSGMKTVTVSRKNCNDDQALSEALAMLFSQKVDIDWQAYHNARPFAS